MGINPGMSPVGNILRGNAWDAAEEGCARACELLPSFLALLLVVLPGKEPKQAFSCGMSSKVNAGDVYKRRPGLGNGISFAYPLKEIYKLSFYIMF
jgi:hypothetical protein